MQKYILLVLTINLFLFVQPVGSQNEIRQQLVLLGNLNHLSADAPILDSLDAFLKKQQSITNVLFSGDFIDDNGIGESANAEDLAKLERLLKLGDEHTHLYFLPGDREWDNGGKKGMKKVKALEDYFKENGKERHHFLAEDACPGPEIIDVGSSIRIIALNTHWFVHKHKKPVEEHGDCDQLNEADLWEAIEDEIKTFENRQVIIAGHHPVISYGGYAGYRQFKRYLLPPFIGSFIGAYHQNIGTTKDLAHEKMKAYGDQMRNLLSRYPGIIYTSGHEYDRQINYAWENYHINSGALVKSKDIGLGKFSFYREDGLGFSMIRIFENGAVDVQVYKTNNNVFTKSHEALLYRPPSSSTPAKVPTNKWFQETQTEGPIDYNQLDLPVSKINSANPFYNQKSKFFQLILGKHYRKTWAEPIEVPYLNLDTLYGGLTPYRKGGAAQTRSLRFKSGDGQYFAFRSVDKNPTRNKDRNLVYGVIGDLYRDITSSQHPYAPFILNHFMDSLDIPHPNAQLFLLPDHPKLGVYREEFQGMLGWLELRPKDADKGKPYKDARKVYHTFEIYKKLIKDHDHRIAKDEYVWARLFDMFVTDWDRHHKNWDWLAYGDKKAMTFYPFAKDRDKALTRMQGLFQALDWPMISREMVRLRKSTRGLKSLNWKNRNMDRLILPEYTLEDWLTLTEKFQATVSDKLIEDAVKQLPPEVYPYSGDEIADILKVRRDRMKKLVTDYYKLLTKYIHFVGSNDEEIFELTRQSNGDVLVEVFKRKKDKKGDLLYRRLCLQKETKEIRLYGLGDDDIFHIKGESKKRMIIRIIGGKGQDQVVDESQVKFIGKQTKVYDYEKKDQLSLGKEGILKNHYEAVNLEMNGFYNDNYFIALPYVYYNENDGLATKILGRYTRQRFNKPGFGAKYDFSFLATTRGNYSMGAGVRFRHVIKRWDLNLSGNFNRPDLSFRQFYGFGNETSIVDSLDNFDYYQNKMSTIKGRVGLQYTFRQRSTFLIDFIAERRKVFPDPEDDGARSIYDAYSNSLNSTLLGPHVQLNMDFRDDPNFPLRGSQFIFTNISFLNSAADWNLGGRYEMIFSNYYSAGKHRLITLGLKGGFRQAYGKTPFYYQSFIGQADNLRGYVRNRFGGRSAAWVNTELRGHVGTIRTPIVPLYFGLFGLFDMGRVWVKNDNSDKWHYAYGGGLYIVPYQKSFNMVLSLAHSPEENLQVSFGIGFFVR